MKQTERKTTNHIKNYIRQLDQRVKLYEKLYKEQHEKDFTPNDRCLLALMNITTNAIADLKALNRWFEGVTDGKN